MTSKNTTTKLDGPMTDGYGIDAIDAVRENQSASNPQPERMPAREHDFWTLRGIRSRRVTEFEIS